jgi:hypothetical protein
MMIGTFFLGKVERSHSAEMCTCQETFSGNQSGVGKKDGRGATGIIGGDWGGAFR